MTLAYQGDSMLPLLLASVREAWRRSETNVSGQALSSLQLQTLLG